ncbi:MAG: hypothetical protein LH613_10180 [Chamaesiphon sp.]|nr:hypothetical protein [Chamaesiphon sp.]
MEEIQPTQRLNLGLQRSGYLLVIASLAQCAWIYLFLTRLFPLSTDRSNHIKIKTESSNPT